MDIQQRIAQFENMTQADPDNDMAWFSLAGAYAQAERHEEAAAAYKRSIDLNPDMSKAYQLAGKALIDADKTEEAAALLTTGYEEAAKRGDRMPQKAMGELLESLGKPVPKVASDATEQAAPEGAFVCARTGRTGTQLPSPPFKGPLGEWIHRNIAAETWRAWIEQGTKVINELRLDFSRDEDQATYDQHMREFLGVDDETLRKIESGADQPQTA